MFEATAAPEPPLDPPGERVRSQGLRTAPKCGFSDVLIGLSGGIDSAVTAVLAADALGPTHVHGVAMPSRFSADESTASPQGIDPAIYAEN